MSAVEGRVFDLVRLAGGKDWALVYVCYLDDSDAEQSSVLTLAGYMAHIDNWKVFESATVPIWAKYGITILHATDFHRGCREFKGWSGSKKMRFTFELYTCALRSGIELGISRSIRKQSYKQRQAELNRNKSMSSYGVAFASIIYTLARGNSKWQEISKETLSFIVESGHNNNEEIQLYYNKMRNDDNFKGALGPFAFGDKKDSRAIQMADFFAFYSRRHAARIDAQGGTGKVTTDRCYSLFLPMLNHVQNVITDPYAGIVLDPQEAVYKADRDPSAPLASEVPPTPKPTRKSRSRAK